MTTRRRGRSSVRRTKRKTTWRSASDTTFTLTQGASSQLGIQLLGPDDSYAGSTLLRTILESRLLPSASTFGQYTVFWGLIMMDGDAVTALAFPDPRVEENAWMQLGISQMQNETNHRDIQPMIISFDTPSRRRLNPRSTLMMIYEVPQAAMNVAALSVSIQARMLIGLP